jgi:antitoxin component YwqK of YwqJK toxin-antitoxin module
MRKRVCPAALALCACLFFPPLCWSEDEKPPEEKVMLATKPEDFPAYRSLVDKMLKASPQGYKVRLTVVSVLDMNVGDRHLERLQSAVPIDPQGQPDGVEEHFATVHYGYLERTVPYKKGVRDGVEKVYANSDEHGGRYVGKEVPWLNGKMHGVVKTFHPNGNVSSETEYVNGLAHGKMRSLSLDGKLRREGTMKDGKRHGTVTEYWDTTGKPERAIPYEAGKVTGVVKEYYAGGQLKREVTFRDDAMHGVEKQFETDGKLSRTRYWFDGEAVSEDEFRKRSRK